MQQVEEAGTVILKVLCGSRAYGLADSDSDFDYHGVFVVPTRDILALGVATPETAWIEGEDMDNTAWELEKFLKLATNSNPTAIEALVAPIEDATHWGLTLRALMPSMISRRGVYEGFKGYAKNQRIKMFEPTQGKLGGQKMGKAAISYLRALHHGIELLERGTYGTYIRDEELRLFLKSVRAAVTPPWGDMIDRAMVLEARLLRAYNESDLPEAVDLEAVNEFVLKIRKEMW